MKLFIAEIREINVAYKIIEKFEKVSGLEMQRSRKTEVSCTAIILKFLQDGKIG